MLSTTPVGPTTILAPLPGGKLLCLWQRNAAKTLQIVRKISELIILPTCGVQSWPNDQKILFVVWARSDQVGILRGLLRAFSEDDDVITWSSRLVLSGFWSTFGGSPVFADREYDLLEMEACA